MANSQRAAASRSHRSTQKTTNHNSTVGKAKTRPSSPSAKPTKSAAQPAAQSATQSAAQSATQAPAPLSKSALSRQARPAKPNKLYRQSEAAIQRAIRQELSQRNLKTSVFAVCRSARIATPTFYAHYSDLNDARHSYERAIEQHFLDSIHALTAKVPTRELIFTYLLATVRQYRLYFTTALRSHDSYLLDHMLRQFETALIGHRSDRAMTTLYFGQLISIITSWALFDQFSLAKVEQCTRRLLHTRLTVLEK